MNLTKSKLIFNSKTKYDNLEIDDRYGSYFLRFTTIDKSGVISGITKEFKNNNISMKTMLQKDQSPNSTNATIVITTHQCLRKRHKKSFEKDRFSKICSKKNRNDKN